MSLTIKLPKATIKVQIEDQKEPILSLNQLRSYIQSISQQLLEDWFAASKKPVYPGALGARGNAWRPRNKTPKLEMRPILKNKC